MPLPRAMVLRDDPVERDEGVLKLFMSSVMITLERSTEVLHAPLYQSVRNRLHAKIG